MKYILILIFLSTSLGNSYCQNTPHCDVGDSEAKFHLGEEITVCGKLVQLSKAKYTKGDPIFLNFGGSFPNQSFTAVIWGDVFQKEFSEALVKYYFAKNLAIYGMVKEYKGKPTITIKEKSQIEILENYEPAFINITPK
ncbi:MAG: hypothetical protein ACKVOU_00160 [Cytophagales bacterium]